MLTARGWWFLVVVVLLLVLGVMALPQYTVVPGILAVTLLAWFAVEWAVFHTRLNTAVARLRVFSRRTFLRGPLEYLVLPPLTDAEGRQRADKRFSTLPPPGIHRFRRPGTGSELLDLRDYRPGDPPKMIAWKPSARRDRLITKEYESDVPVRCVLFLDTSESMRLGPPGNTGLTRMASVASAVAQASA